MASFQVASAPRAPADSRRPLFVTTCHRFCHERRVVTRSKASVVGAAARRRKPRIHQPWLQPRTWRPAARSACRGSPCGAHVRAASFLGQLFDLCLLAQRVSSVFSQFCLDDDVWPFRVLPKFSSLPHVPASPATRCMPPTSRGTPSVRRLPSLIIDDDQSLRRLNASIRRLFVSALLQEHDTVNPCGKLAGFVLQRRRWLKIS